MLAWLVLAIFHSAGLILIIKVTKEALTTRHLSRLRWHAHTALNQMSGMCSFALEMCAAGAGFAMFGLLASEFVDLSEDAKRDAQEDLMCIPMTGKIIISKDNADSPDMMICLYDVTKVHSV